MRRRLLREATLGPSLQKRGRFFHNVGFSVVGLRLKIVGFGVGRLLAENTFEVLPSCH